MPGEELIPIVRAGARLAGKASDDRAERAMLQELGTASPTMKGAAEAYARRVAVKQQILLKVMQPLARLIGVRREYFDTDFSADMAEKLASVPEEDLISPAPSVAIPSFEGLSYSLDEPALRDMYLNLLATASDGRVARRAHPSFAEVIKQLAPAEAPMLLDVLRTGALPICRVARLAVDAPGKSVVNTNVLDIRHKDTDEADEDESTPIWVDNWVRLGLITVDYSRFLTREGAYDFVARRPEYLRAVGSDPRGEGGIDIDKGMLVPTAFGKQFLRAVSFDGVPVPDTPGTPPEAGKREGSGAGS